MKVLEAEKFPRLHSWFNNFKDALVIKERGLLFEYVNQTYLGCISNPRMSITSTNILLYCNLKFQPLDLKYIPDASGFHVQKAFLLSRRSHLQWFCWGGLENEENVLVRVLVIRV